MTTRRDLLGAATALTGALALPTPTLAGPAPQSAFVRRDGTRLTLGGKPYRFAGANIWYGAYLGAKTGYGDRDRLRRELDKLQSIGVSNLRLLASSETSPLKNAVKPSFRNRGTVYNPALLDGLDFCLAEMGTRGMKGVLYLTNFWEWSGGMMTYLSYVNGGKYIDANDPAHPWPAFADATSEFYRTPKAVALYHEWISALVGRTNGVTGTPYRDDPTIMAWQLANEPRPGGGPEVAARNLPFFQDWVRGTARLIKTLDRNHLVSTGSEGLKGTVERADIYTTEHGFPEIDYCTAHIWPLNWSWVDARNLPGTHEAGRAKVAEYLQQHEALARGLDKPLVIEEFGYPRDGGGYDPESTTAFKDRYYGQIFDAVLNSARTGGPIAGSNFWAWNGEGRAVHGDHRFRDGDTHWVGDPPHEPQGWYGVYDADATTHALIRAHAQSLAVAAAPTAAR